MRTLLAVLLLVGCSGDEPATTDASVDAYLIDGHFDGPAPLLTLTSPTITEGGAIPLTHVCANRGGQNQSPQLVFTNAPAGTLSFAVVLTDMSNSLVHCAIYDVPGSVTTGASASTTCKR